MQPSTAEQFVTEEKPDGYLIYAKKIGQDADINVLRSRFGALITECRGEIFQLSICGSDPDAVADGYDHFLLIKTICTNAEHRSQILEVLERP